MFRFFLCRLALQLYNLLVPLAVNRKRMHTIQIAGVPEHFNYPWQLGIESGKFADAGIDLRWANVPEGTGRLCEMLRNGETDAAVILTEGVIKDIIAGNDCSIVQVFVETPLLWGIHVAAGSPYNAVEDLIDRTVAISRFGSGSHLMAIVNAKQMGWPPESLKYEVVNTIEGASETLTKGQADYFMWERFMTKPLVDKGIFRHLEDCPTPWPSFVIAVRNNVLQQQQQVIDTVLGVINEISETIKERPTLEAELAECYGQKVEDISEWLSKTEWSQQKLTREAFEKVQHQLFDIGIIDRKTTFENATG